MPRKQSKNKNMSSRIATLEKKVAMRKPETKRYYNDVENQFVVDENGTDKGYTFNLTSIAQGNNENEREGNEVRATGVYGKFVVKGVQSLDTMLRGMLLIPKDPNDTGYENATVASHLDEDRYTVLKDVFMALNPNGGPNARTITFRKKFKYPLRLQYSTSSGGSCVRNNVKLHFVSDQNIAGNAPVISGYVYLYYHE